MAQKAILFDWGKCYGNIAKVGIQLHKKKGDKGEVSNRRKCNWNMILFLREEKTQTVKY